MLNKKSLISALLSATLLATPALAQDKPKPQLQADTVVATVNGQDFTWADVLNQAQLIGVPAHQHPPHEIVKMITTRALVASENEKLLAGEPLAQKQLAFYRSALIFSVYLNKQRPKMVTESDVKAEYKAFIKDFDGTQLKASHILVKEEKTAKDIIKKLDGGADFAKLATEKSTGPSARNGGDLGWFGKGAMVPEFEQATLKLQKGKYTKSPVKTQFGYHVIKLTDRKTAPKPTLAELRQQIENTIFERKVNVIMEEKAKSPKIKLKNQDLLNPQG